MARGAQGEGGDGISFIIRQATHATGVRRSREIALRLSLVRVETLWQLRM